MIYPATDETIARAAQLLAAGNLVGMPTETVYGLAANAWNASAVLKIFAAKTRPPSNPLIVHVASIDRLSDAIAWPPTPQIQRQLDAIVDLWPGPLTVVCPRNERMPNEVTAGRLTVAVRVPAHDVALAILEACPFPLAAPSANRSKYVSPTHAEHLYGPGGIVEHVAMVIDGGPCRWGVESTIVKLGDEVPTLLRPGAVALQELADRFGVDAESMLLPEAMVEGALLAPGMMREHYSPSTPLLLLDRVDVSRSDFPMPSTGTCRAGRIAFQPISKDDADCYSAVEILSSSGDLREVAHHLFAAMRRLDSERLDVIHCDTCSSAGIGHAIMDRLRRAAAKDA